MTLTTPSGQTLLDLGLEAREQNGEQVARAAELASSQRGLSTVDCLVLVLAQDLRAPLVTGDAELRRKARSQGLEVHGTIWVVEELITAGIIGPAAGADALEGMCTQGRRLPLTEVEKRVQLWRGVA
ncbi:MAG: type II toxin-antitoxin system VapC family toxin [Chloroflexi bacterium]|nr:type II toxin-antitoxin system VapC family toxin [Chloroflexota bacterium]